MPFSIDSENKTMRYNLYTEQATYAKELVQVIERDWNKKIVAKITEIVPTDQTKDNFREVWIEYNDGKVKKVPMTIDEFKLYKHFKFEILGLR